MSVDIFINNGKELQHPAVTDNIVWSTDRSGAAGKLTFTVVKDEHLSFFEGNEVILSIDGQKIFYGFVFTKKRNKQPTIDVTAYDQLRYFVNKDVYQYSNMTASEVIKMIVTDMADPNRDGFQMNLGNIAQTSFIIQSRTEDNQSLFDIINNALKMELENTGNMYVMYDDVGKITLKSADDMRLDYLLDSSTGQDIDYQSSIDDQTYNEIKLIFDNKDTGMWDTYIEKDSNNINNWGLLRYTDKLQDGENGQVKADQLLRFYNVETRRLKISKAFGRNDVRAGSWILCNLSLGDIVYQNYALVEKCVHTWSESEHWMDLTLLGGAMHAKPLSSRMPQRGGAPGYL